MVDAGALMVGSFAESSALVAVLSVSFALARDQASIARTRTSTGVTLFQPTFIDGRPPSHRETGPTAIVAQSSDEARSVWLVIEQVTRDLEDTLIIPQTVINSWVWHVDFRGPKDGGFHFGLLSSVRSSCSYLSHHLDTRMLFNDFKQPADEFKRLTMMCSSKPKKS